MQRFAIGFLFCSLLVCCLGAIRLTISDELISDSGTITLGGTGGTNNEQVSIDFETTQNSLDLSSATGVTKIDLGPMNSISSSVGPEFSIVGANIGVGANLIPTERFHVFTTGGTDEVRFEHDANSGIVFQMNPANVFVSADDDAGGARQLRLGGGPSNTTQLILETNNDVLVGSTTATGARMRVENSTAEVIELSDGTNSYGLSVDATGIWHDNNHDGVKDGGEEYINLSGSSAAMDPINLYPWDGFLADTSTNEIDTGALPPHVTFDAATDEDCEWMNLYPVDYQGGNLTITCTYKMDSATSGSVTFEGELWAVTDGETLTTRGYGTVVFATETVPGTAGLQDTITLTFDAAGELDSLADGDNLFVRLGRDADGTNGTDDATGDMHLVSAVVEE